MPGRGLQGNIHRGDVNSEGTANSRPFGGRQHGENKEQLEARVASWGSGGGRRDRSCSASEAMLRSSVCLSREGDHGFHGILKGFHDPNTI